MSLNKSPLGQKAGAEFPVDTRMFSPTITSVDCKRRPMLMYSKVKSNSFGQNG